jgi:hypothetical protein
MAFINNPSTDLSRYSIGEIAGLSGVPNFYNAGSSKWLRSATATASSNLSATIKTNLANAGTAEIATVLGQSSLSSSTNSRGLYATYPIARISASSISVVPSIFEKSYSVGVGVVTSAGLQVVGTGQTSNVANNSAYSNVVVASNNTTIFSYCFTSPTALGAAYTTTGTTWTIGTVTGIPVFNTGNDMCHAHASFVGNEGYTVASTGGWKRTGYAAGGYNQFAVFWCGARFVLIGPAATNYMVSLSTNGLAWGGDNTTAVIGATAQSKALDIQFYRNGNNCYLNVGTAYRYSTDGGVTWAASTFAAAPSPTDYYMYINQTDPAKMVIVLNASSSDAYYSADSGATWSANRAFPFISPAGLYYKGSTLVASNAAQTIYKVSTDNGTTWVTPTFPIGTLGFTIGFFGDANRFYAGVFGQPQLLTSTDAVTWTLVTVPQNFALRNRGTISGNGIITYDSNTVVLLGYNSNSGFNQFFSTTDGGVTWTAGQFTVSNLGGFWGVGSCFVTPDGGGIAFPFGMTHLASGENTNVLKTDITAGGAFYRTGTSAITPVQANSFAYVRVG